MPSLDVSLKPETKRWFSSLFSWKSRLMNKKDPKYDTFLLYSGSHPKAVT